MLQMLRPCSCVPSSASQSEAAEARAQLQGQAGCLSNMAAASEIATATAQKLLVEKHSLQGRLSQVTQEMVDVKAIWAECGSATSP